MLQLEHITSSDFIDVLEQEKRNLQITINNQMRLAMIQGLVVAFCVLLIGVLISKSI
jgi:hypothetical protein